MERASQLSCPSFWKLLTEDDFNRGIRIPHSFSNHLERRKYPCNYSLITEDKQKRSPDRSWRAKLVKKDHYFYLCRKSWPEFVRDHDLKYGDLLLFHLVGETTFRVLPYGADGSVKKKLHDVHDSTGDDDDSDTGESESDVAVVRTSKKRRQYSGAGMDEPGGSTPASKKVKIEEIIDDSDEDEPRGASRRSGNSRYNKEVDANSRKKIQEISSAGEASKWDNYYDLGVQKPYFIRTIKNGHKYCLVIPRPFARATNLDRVEEVELQWEDGDLKRSYIAKMIHSDKYGRVDIGDGWSEFRQSTFLSVGETCRFSVTNRRGLITVSVHVFRFGTDHWSRNRK